MIYIAKFVHATNQQEKDEVKRRHGEFNLLIAADSKDAAVEKFKRRIIQVHQSTDFFTGDAFIYLVHVLEMEEVPRKDARLFNFQSIAGDPVMPIISCQAPADGSDGCRILDWQENRPGVDGQTAVPFMQFSKS